MDLHKLQIHPAAEVFPLLEGAEFEALVEDIRTNGLRMPILLDHQDRLLDGRNRLRACRAAGIEPRFEYWDDGADPLDVVISQNVRRRHLNESQRAMVAARLLPQIKVVQKDATSSLNVGRHGRAGIVAGMLGVSHALVERARKVLGSGNADLIHAVDSGQLRVSAAARRLQPPRPEPQGQPLPVVHARWADPPCTGPWPKQFANVAPDPNHAVLLLYAPPSTLRQVRRLITARGRA